jgi:hypothetical protein
VRRGASQSRDDKSSPREELGSGRKVGVSEGKDRQGRVGIERRDPSFDFSRVISDDAEEPQTIDSYTSGRLCRIFVVHNVPEDTEFKTQTRKEIAKIQWAPVAALPDPGVKNARAISDSSVSQQDLQQFHEKNFGKAWLVSQYAPKLLSYIKRCKQAHVAGGASTGSGDSRHPDNKQANSQLKVATNSTLLTASEVQIKKPDAKKRRTANDEEHAKTTVGVTSQDMATFGLDGGRLRMTEKEKHDLFRTYVEAADKRAAELGLGDDFWPVPYVTSKDFPPRSGATVDCDLSETRMTEHLYEQRGIQDASTIASEKVCCFRFDRDRVLACLS